jgi:hypothetical protein
MTDKLQEWIEAVERAADDCRHAAKAERDTAYYYKDSATGGAKYLSRAKASEDDATRLAELAAYLRDGGKPALVRIDPAEYADGLYTTPTGAVIRVEKPDGGWLPIESAPKDGTRILAWGSLLGGEPCAAIVDWCDSIYGVSGQGGWLVTHDAEAYHWEGFIPTHYRPLPAPPAALATPGEG